MTDGATLLLLRHGEIIQSEPRRFVGQRDLVLTETGRRQAEAWSPVLAEIPLAGAWCSDLLRCRETATLALAGSGLVAAPVPGLREICLGQWEGLSVAEVQARFPGEHERRGADLAGVAPGGGESFAQAQARAWEALSGILAGRTGTLLAVAHAGVNRAILCQVLGMPLCNLFRLGQEYGCMNILEFKRGKPPSVLALNVPPSVASGRLELRRFLR